MTDRDIIVNPYLGTVSVKDPVTGVLNRVKLAFEQTSPQKTSNPLLLSINSKIASRYNANFCFQEHTAPATACLADGDRVGTMVDLAGGFNLAATATDTTRGTFNLAGSNLVGGLPSVTFAATTQKLISGSTFWDRFDTTGVTIMALVKMAGTNAYRVLCGKSGAQYPYFAMRNRVGGYENVQTAMGVVCDAPIANVSTGNPNDSALTRNLTSFENTSVIWGSISAAKVLQSGRGGTPITTSVVGSGTLAGALLLGDGGVGGLNAQMPIHEICFYTGVLTQDELNAEAKRLMSLQPILPEPLILIDSNSFGNGYYSSVENRSSNAETLLKANLSYLGAPGSTVNTINLSVSGQTTTTKLGVSPGVLNKIGDYGSYRKVAYLLWEATNDMQAAGGDKTAAQAWANTLSLINTAKAAGVTDIFVPTVFVRSASNAGAGFEARRLAYNELVRANAAAAGAIVIDLVGIFPELDLTANITNTAILNDQIHPTPAYYAKINYQFAKSIMSTWFAQN